MKRINVELLFRPRRGINCSLVSRRVGVAAGATVDDAVASVWTRIISSTSVNGDDYCFESGY